MLRWIAAVVSLLLVVVGSSFVAARAGNVAGPSGPSLLLEGISYSGIEATGSCTSRAATCPGSFTAVVSGHIGPKITLVNATLQIDFKIKNPAFESFGRTGPGPLLGCWVASGTGSLLADKYNVILVGQMCVPDFNTTQLSGAVSIKGTQAVSAQDPEDVNWGTGTLVSTGSLHLFAPGNPIPAGGISAVSIVGAVEQIPPNTP